MKTFVIQFTNGEDTRTAMPLRQYPDDIFALMDAQKLAIDMFALPWNKVADQRKWAVIVRSDDGEILHKKPVALTLTADDVANIH